jgi:hypothetical protein
MGFALVGTVPRQDPGWSITGMPSAPAIRDAAAMADSPAATLTRASAEFRFVTGDDTHEYVSRP